MDCIEEAKELIYIAEIISKYNPWTAFQDDRFIDYPEYFRNFLETYKPPEYMSQGSMKFLNQDELGRDPNPSKIVDFALRQFAKCVCPEKFEQLLQNLAPKV